MEISATEAKNRLGQVLEAAQREPVIIGKAGRRHSVVLSHERYQQLLAAEAGESPTQRKQRFEAEHRDWIEEQQRHFDQQGSWSDELRTW